MSRIDPKLTESILAAEEAVQSSIHRFENAMVMLTDKVEGASQKIHHVRDVARESKEKLVHFKDEVQATLAPLQPYVKKVGVYSTSAVRVARKIPKPYLMAAAGVVGCWLAYRYWSKKREAAQLQAQTSGTRAGEMEFSTDYESEFPYQ